MNDEVIGVIDLDSYEFDRYSQLEQNALEKIAQMLSKGCDWSNW